MHQHKIQKLENYLSLMLLLRGGGGKRWVGNLQVVDLEGARGNYIGLGAECSTKPKTYSAANSKVYRK